MQHKLPPVLSLSVQSNYFRGYIRLPGTVQNNGSTSNVIVRTSDQCTNSAPSYNRFSTAWSMLAGGGGGDGYAQTGFMKYEGAHTRNFAEYSQNSPGTFYRVFGNANLLDGDLYHYWQLYSTNCPPLEAGGQARSCIVLKINSATISYTNFNPYSSWASPFNNQYFGETTYQESRIPGTVSTPTDLNVSQWLSPAGWQNLRCQDLVRQDPAIQHNASNQKVITADGSNCRHIQIWGT